MRAHDCGQAGFGSGTGMSFASFRRFWAVAARVKHVGIDTFVFQPNFGHDTDALRITAITA